MKKKLYSSVPKSSDPSKSQGNKTVGSKNYKNPVGKNDRSTPPPTSGYDEKQPVHK